MSERRDAAAHLIEVIEEHVPPSKRGRAHSAVGRLLIVDDAPADGCKVCGTRLPPYQGRGRPLEYCRAHAPKPRLGESREKSRVGSG